MTRVIDHGSWTETITDLSECGRMTVISRKDPEAVPVFRLPHHGGLGTGLVRIIEADAATDQAAEDVTTEWDRRWAIGQ
jgi:hypothetical protein